MVRRTDRLLLDVRVSFEATRFGPQHLIETYARLGAADEPAAQAQQRSAAKDEVATVTARGGDR